MNSGKLNPYTQAMVNCLQQFEDNDEVPELDESTSQFLANMVQGRFLQYLVNRICELYEITDKKLEKKLIMVLMTILSSKFFAVFREKVRAKPEIVYMVARKITSSETSGKSNNAARTDALYRNICKKYFEYQNFNVILTWINTNPEVEKIIFLSRVQRRIQDAGLIKALRYIIRNDKDGIAPAVFNRYLQKNKLQRLTSMVQTGDWKIEAAFVQQESTKMIAWRNYMAQL